MWWMVDGAGWDGESDWGWRCRTHRTGTGDEHHNHNAHSALCVVDVVYGVLTFCCSWNITWQEIQMVMQIRTPRVWVFDSAPSGEEDQLMAICAQSAYPRIKKQKPCLFSLPRRQVLRGSLQSVVPLRPPSVSSIAFLSNARHGIHFHLAAFISFIPLPLPLPLPINPPRHLS